MNDMVQAAPQPAPLVANRPVGVLVVNVGTPDAPDPSSVRRYLRQFLNDPRVIDIPALARFLLLNLVILPFRPRKSAAAYQQVWTDEGSPLLIFTMAMADRLRTTLGNGYRVLVGMRYGNPSLESALTTLRNEGIDDIIVFPAYPQYAASSTGTALREVFHLAGELWNVPRLHVVPPFYDHEATLDACAEVARPMYEEMVPDHVLFSFHGLPERHVVASDTSGNWCLQDEACCHRLNEANRHCYRAQCYATARGVASRLNLVEGTWSVAFQSRLGRTPWIQPYPDHVIVDLARQGNRTVMVQCPSFVADCLETLEEIGIRAREDFIAEGGEDLQLVPGLNAHPAWIRAAAELICRHGPKTPVIDEDDPKQPD